MYIMPDNIKLMVVRGCNIYHPELSNIMCCNVGIDCVIHSHVWIGNKVAIGSRVKIQAFAFIPDGVIIQDDVFIGPHVCFVNDKYPPSNGNSWKVTVVKKGASIGANATILCGVVIGENAMIGAGSVVTKDVEPDTIVAGNPAKPIG